MRVLEQFAAQFDFGHDRLGEIGEDVDFSSVQTRGFLSMTQNEPSASPSDVMSGTPA